MSADRISVRVAREDDTDAIVAIVNEAYLVEAFFVGGDRVGAAEVLAGIQAGECYVAEAEDRVVATIQVAVEGRRGYFGMLAVAPSAQRHGLGRRLIALAEAAVRDVGCDVMEIKVVNLRADLIGFYTRLGYKTTGTEPYVHRPVSQPCHFVLMRKVL